MHFGLLGHLKFVHHHTIWSTPYFCFSCSGKPSIRFYETRNLIYNLLWFNAAPEAYLGMQFSEQIMGSYLLQMVAKVIHRPDVGS